MISLLFLFSCTTVQTGSFQVCDLELSPEPAAAFPGQTVVITGGPLSADFDGLVSIDGVRAEVEGIERTECDACDSCLIENDCQACGRCLPCTETCSTCVETTTIVVPEVPAGDTRLTMVNVFGTGVTPFRVRGLHTGSTGDTGAPADTAGPADTAPPADTGANDTATSDTASTDTATPDTAAPNPTADTAVSGGSPTGSTADTGADTATSSTADTGGLAAPTGDTSAP